MTPTALALSQRSRGLEETPNRAQQLGRSPPGPGAEWTEGVSSGPAHLGLGRNWAAAASAAAAAAPLSQDGEEEAPPFSAAAQLLVCDGPTAAKQPAAEEDHEVRARVPGLEDQPPSPDRPGRAAVDSASQLPKGIRWSISLVGFGASQDLDDAVQAHPKDADRVDGVAGAERDQAVTTAKLDSRTQFWTERLVGVRSPRFERDAAAVHGIKSARDAPFQQGNGEHRVVRTDVRNHSPPRC
eukprot:CAMPEP_0172648568 /NCGR_PEP_ID=MMETSP1068-20121228/241338_1 /TAXON_ID=35684 /ORGANISM="Pseudopedinella elastica, Strain CCMP716" /LENGTH=240 /DNA_ID=CAMNT_0013462889 /DNA_START=312 /DNA_END=1035 /DNA_ORIENTATION=+